jgi:hypothetical protein
LGTVQNTMVELGTDPDSWALFPAELAASAESTRVRAIPFAPPITVTGNVVVPDDGTPDYCVETTVAAFRD